MRTKLLVGNWKMNKSPKEAASFALDSKEEVEFAFEKGIEIGIAPTFLCLDTLRKLASEKILLLAQNTHFEEKGAFTGEVSPEMLKSIDVDGSIIGHSERRTYDNETSLKCNKKIKALLKNNLIPLYCVGETEGEFEEGKTRSVIKTQLEEGLKELSNIEMARVIVAYEPVWSIGTGKNASKEIAESVCSFIREQIEKMYPTVSEHVRILYGGSVKPNNIKEYLAQSNIDGALVGGASLEVSSFSQMIHALTD